jgi:hypothetical protein
MISNIYPNDDPDTAAKKLAKDHKKIDDHDRIRGAFGYIESLNQRLVNFKLELEVIPLQKNLDGEEF